MRRMPAAAKRLRTKIDAVIRISREERKRRQIKKVRLKDNEANI